MTTAALRKKLVEYMQVADEEKVKAIYTIIADEINTTANDWDEDYIKELKKRSNQFKRATVKTYSWEETKQAAQNNAKSKK